jgi:hypothetical protein
MRQALHIAIGLAFWALLAVLWLLLALEGKTTGAAFRDTGLQLAALMGAVLAITIWWIRHNVGIYRRKGPRRARAEMEPCTDEDRLGHAVRWALPDGPVAATTEQHVIVEVDGAVKTYRRAG